VVVPFAEEGGAALNDGGTADDDWLGIAVQQVLQFKLSYVPGILLWQYDRYRATPVREYTMPIPGESVDARVASLVGSVGRWPLVLGTFLGEGEDVRIRVYAVAGGTRTAQLVNTQRGKAREIGKLLDRAMPALLQAILPAGESGGSAWRGEMPTDSPEALEWFARGVLAAQEGTEQAGLCYQSAVDLDPSFLAARWAMAPICRSRRDYRGALEHINAVAAAVPHDVQVRMARASALSSVGDFMAAVEEYRLCTELDSRLESSLNQYIVRCYSRANRLDEALKWANELLATAPDDASALMLGARRRTGAGIGSWGSAMRSLGVWRKRRSSTEPGWPGSREPSA
jgi:tetratricopeptide (TPR) repeat protein